ncbi:ABC transporter substrate-binding protein [Roseibium aggregatum]|uniref:ABC transporter substrate-binding protein n=1 Tax=Roseibium aggregatum TaxID=187304 RepID=UPI0025AD02D6|nr:ABC transporter substrate-binding protein [Roseibium aggregatum]WJS05469.1 ABC transporter substrate-binding protein [Roseibium aggregatum]
MRITRLLGAVAVLAALTGNPALAEDRPDIVIAVQDNPPQLDPVLFSRNVSLRTLYNVFDYPISIDFKNGWEPKPGLAESWQRIDDTTLELKLRKGVKFHDGSEMTSRDFVFSYGPVHMSAEDSPGYALTRPYLGTVSSVEAVDEYTVQIKTKAPDPLLEQRLAGWSSQIVSQAAFEKAGSWEAWALAPVGTGPYKVAEYVAGDHLTLEAHDDYWGGKPPFASLRFQIVPETAARIAGLVAGDFDIITEVEPDQFATIEAAEGVSVIGDAVANHRVINLGTNSGWLADAKVRQALSLAIDRQLIADTIFAGKIPVPNGFQWEAYGDLYEADYPGAEFDPEKAKALLKEAGYDGSPIVYRTQTGYYTAELLTSQAVADMWRSVGVNVELKVVDGWGQVLEQPVNAAFNGSINMNYPDMLGSLWPLYGPTGFIQSSAKTWSNERFEEIGKTLETEFDREIRADLHRETLDIFHKVDPPAIVVHALGMFYGIRDGLEWQPYPLPYMDFRPENAGLKK